MSDTADGQHIPTDINFLYGYATTPRYVSLRRARIGSWYINRLCEVFNTYAHEEHALELMTRVSVRGKCVARIIVL